LGIKLRFLKNQKSLYWEAIMWNKFNKGVSSVIVILAFSVAVIFSSNTADAQSLWKINSQNPGGGTTTGTTFPQDNNSHTGLYILAGALIVGFVLYKVAFQNNDEPADSSDSTSSLIPAKSNVIRLQAESVIPQNEPPVNVYLGIRRDNYNSPIQEKTYIVGVSLKF
jgi:hypothetical protein